MSFPLARPEVRNLCYLFLHLTNPSLNQFRPFLSHWPGLDFSVPPSERVRPMMASMPPPPLPDASKLRLHNEVVPAEFEGGEGEIRLLVIGPIGKEKEIRDTVVVFHGGGFMIGMPE